MNKFIISTLISRYIFDVNSNADDVRLYSEFRGLYQVPTKLCSGLCCGNYNFIIEMLPPLLDIFLLKVNKWKQQNNL